MDGGYAGTWVDWVAERFKSRLSVVLHPKESQRFVLPPRRWVVERTFGWLNHSHRLGGSQERFTLIDETWIYIAIIRVMLRKLHPF